MTASCSSAALKPLSQSYSSGLNPGAPGIGTNTWGANGDEEVLRRSVDELLPGAEGGAVFACFTGRKDLVNGIGLCVAGILSCRVENHEDELGCSACMVGVDAMGGAGGE